MPPPEIIFLEHIFVLFIFSHLFVITDKRHVEEVLLLPDGVEGRAHVVLEVVPFQTELFIGSHFGKSLSQKFVKKLLKDL